MVMTTTLRAGPSAARPLTGRLSATAAQITPKILEDEVFTACLNLEDGLRRALATGFPWSGSSMTVNRSNSTPVPDEKQIAHQKVLRLLSRKQERTVMRTASERGVAASA